MEYNLTDHLGSTRMMYKLNFTCAGAYQNATINYMADPKDADIYRQYYFSFGKIAREYINPGTTAEKYQYTGKERDTESGYDYFNARNYHSEVGRFLSIDPLAEKYAGWSSYNYTMNNPINLVDPDGMEADDVIINGEHADQAVTELNSNSSLIITRNAETGKLSAKGKAKGKAERLLLQAINDPNINVNIETTSAQLYDSKDGTKNIPLLPGGFEGSTVNNDGTVTATQLLNVENAKLISGVIGERTGETIRHEINEAYSGALQSPGGNYDSAYEAAHLAASKVDGVAHPQLQLNENTSRSPNVLQIRKAGTKEWKDLGIKTKMNR
jgi:RHS repeat-associated protein